MFDGLTNSRQLGMKSHINHIIWWPLCIKIVTILIIFTEYNLSTGTDDGGSRSNFTLNICTLFCFSIIFYMINMQGIIEFSMEFATPITQIYWLTYLYGISVHDMQRAYKSHIAVYSVTFFAENHCVKKMMMIIIIILNMDVSLLWELVWGSFSMFIKRSVMLLWDCWMLRPGYLLVFVVFLFFGGGGWVIKLDIIDAVLKNVKSTNVDILSDETCFVVHSEYEGHVMRRLKDVWLKYTCILKRCLITMTFVSHNIYLWIVIWIFKMATWWFTTFMAPAIKQKVHSLPGVEYLYSVMSPDQLEIPAYITEYDMSVSIL